ncbi:hypothetical protein KQX54_002800 [Cotesia glomerata]|uniref:Uncharacterized protein n=1 Tax=Cotesia glomerata TaxID=32391 RepID=A0AAV7IMI7_COTGL|nr:hypothetical protein KQX54_002800 [Cotesia glomerata]
MSKLRASSPYLRCPFLRELSTSNGEAALIRGDSGSCPLAHSSYTKLDTLIVSLLTPRKTRPLRLYKPPLFEPEGEKERNELTKIKNKDRSCSFYSCLWYVIIPRACFINGFYLWYCELYNQPPRYDDLLRIINSSHTYAKPVFAESFHAYPHLAQSKERKVGGVMD